MKIIQSPIPSGRFLVTYAISPSRDQSVESVARDICLEQTVELPEECIPVHLMAGHITGRIENIVPSTELPDKYHVTISIRCDLATSSIPQFLNTLFGNISIKNNIRLIGLDLPDEVLTIFPGPSFGIAGIRLLLGAPDRPLTCAALKPVGLTPHELAKTAGQFAQGCVDIIKEDHGISNQPTARFDERVCRVQEAVAAANAQTGHTTLYCPMLNDSPKILEHQVSVCLKAGIKGVLAAPSLIGYGAFADLAMLRKFVVIAHPAFSGTFFATREHGATPALFLGTIFRLLGADVSIFPNAGGRFPFTQQECDDLCSALRRPWGKVADAFPAPAGGMGLERIPQMIGRYGNDTVFIIGGNLMQHPDGLTNATKAFVESINTTL